MAKTINPSPPRPKGTAVGDEDPDYSPMDDGEEPMTVRGEDGHVHKLEELNGTQPKARPKDDRPARPVPRPSNPD